MTNACTFCKAGLACATQRVTYAFYCRQCKRWFAQGRGGKIEIASRFRSTCKLPEVPLRDDESRFEHNTYSGEVCVDCTMERVRKRHERQALREAEISAAMDLAEFS